MLFFLAWQLLSLAVVLSDSPTKAPEEYSFGGFCDSGSSQSPVDIVTSNIKPDDAKTFVTLEHYDKSITILYRTVNNMYYNELVFFRKPQSGQNAYAYLRRDNLPTAKYRFHNARLRWKCTEHAIDGKKWDFEVQLMHYNVKYAKRIAEQSLDGVLGLAILYQLDASNNSGNNPGVDRWVNILQQFKPNDQSHYTAQTQLVLSLPFNESSNSTSLYDFKLYHYNGSLTSERCFQTVRWFVLPTIGYVANEQIDYFINKVYSNKSDMMCRELKPMNEREVRYAGGGLYTNVISTPDTEPDEKEDDEDDTTTTAPSRGDGILMPKGALTFATLLTMGSVFVSYYLTIISSQ